MQPVGVLFVCKGNICRSPMAEAVFRQMVQAEGLAAQIRIDSAGTGDWHAGEPPHQGTRQVLQEKGIDYAGIQARQVTPDDLRDFDYVVAMDQENLRDLRRFQAGGGRTVHLLMDFAPASPVREVPDPWYTGRFHEVYDLVEAGCRGLLVHIRQREGI